MIKWVLKKFGYVRESAIDAALVYYTGRIQTQKATIDTQTKMLYKRNREIKDLKETIQILRNDYYA